MSKEYQLRPAVKTDQAAIKALIKEVGINPLGLKWERFITAVDENGRIIGCGQVKPHRDGSRELASIAVVKEWRKRGIARAIIQELQKVYGRPLWLTCVDKLTPFYQPFGFVEITDPGHMPPYFRRAKHFFNLYLKLTRHKRRLAVMVWNDTVNVT